jgi:hypothetical protein
MEKIDRRAIGRMSPEERLDRKTVKSDGCWLWTGTTIPAGYGYLTIRGVRHRAHRLSYELRVGPIPEGLHLDRACVNPDHLEPVTNRENIRRGAGTKLTSEAVGQIKRLCENGWVFRDIAQAFGISVTYLNYIRSGLYWSDVEPDPQPQRNA